MPWHNLGISDNHLDTIVRWGYFVGFPLVLGVVLAFLYFSGTTNSQLRAQNAQLSNYAARIQMLSEQNKDLNTATQGVVAQNREYIRCVANTFATYTQNHRPVAFTDLDKCQVSGSSSQASSSASALVHSGNTSKSTSKPSSNSSASGQAVSQMSSGSSLPNSSTPGNTSQPNNPQPKKPNCTVDLLFIHIGKCQ